MSKQRKPRTIPEVEAERDEIRNYLDSVYSKLKDEDVGCFVAAAAFAVCVGLVIDLYFTIFAVCGCVALLYCFFLHLTVLEKYSLKRLNRELERLEWQANPAGKWKKLNEQRQEAVDEVAQCRSRLARAESKLATLESQMDEVRAEMTLPDVSDQALSLPDETAERGLSEVRVRHGG